MFYDFHFVISGGHMTQTIKFEYRLTEEELKEILVMALMVLITGQVRLIMILTRLVVRY